MQGLERTPIGGSKWGISLWEFQVWDGPEPQPTSRTFPGLVPLPQQVEELDADPFVLDSATSIEASGEAVAVAEVLAERLQTSTGFDLPVVADAPANSIRFVLDEGFESLGGASPEEGYELTVGADAVVITAGDPHGLFNGTATLRQLFPAMIESSTVVNTAWSAPAVEIADAPRFVHRGIQLDPAFLRGGRRGQGHHRHHRLLQADQVPLPPG